MNKLIPLISFSILLLVPVGDQLVFGDHETLSDGLCLYESDGIQTFEPCTFHPMCLPNDLSPVPRAIVAIGGISDDTSENCPGEIGKKFDLPGRLCSDPNNHVEVCFTPSYPYVTVPEQCQDGSELDENGHCVPDLNFLCSSGTIPAGLQCVAEALGSMIGGELLDINTVSLLVGAIGTNPVITSLVGITIAGVAGQAVWFVHRRKKSENRS